MKILVIDDDGNVGQAMRAILAGRHYETVFALRATTGILVLPLHKFDLVIVDIFMPEMGGLDTITRIRKDSAVPILAVSGFKSRQAPSVDYFSHALRCGATARLRKPFTPAQLLAAVDKCLASA
jgi:CheY-like chemotaxis protein